MWDEIGSNKIFPFDRICNESTAVQGDFTSIYLQKTPPFLQRLSLFESFSIRPRSIMTSPWVPLCIHWGRCLVMCGIFGPRFQKAGELGLPVGVMPFKGLSQHIDDLEDGW